MTVLERFEFRTVTELKGLTDNLPISLQLLLSASTVTITDSTAIAITILRNVVVRSNLHSTARRGNAAAPPGVFRAQGLRAIR